MSKAERRNTNDIRLCYAQRKAQTRERETKKNRRGLKSTKENELKRKEKKPSCETNELKRERKTG